ncbi:MULTISPECIES: hypothetical protein [unclassified Mycobacterium]|uniref:hypothetical protein n=1 Tax=unclassified Mycobacterium TaxID=2642494 RepID=UPI0029C6A2E4|nr:MULTISPECIES: hypothetical protein [unclassified Mycobacterium]
MTGVTSDATYEWAHAGYDVLVDVARKPNSHITYQEIADALQDTTGIRAGGATWIDTTLALVAEMCVRNGEPQLTALVVEADSLEVGDEFAITYSIAGQLLPKNLQRAAAELRAKCYDHFSRREAVGWDRTKLTGRTGTPRTPPVRVLSKPKHEPVAPTVCAQCRLVLLPSGRCGYCD